MKGIYEIETEHDINTNNWRLAADKADKEPIDSGDIRNLRRVDAKSYVEQNQRNVNLTSLGFDNDMDNLFGESKIVMEFDQNFTERGTRTVSDLCQLLTDVRIPLDNQQLIDTGTEGRFDSNGTGFHQNSRS